MDFRIYLLFILPTGFALGNNPSKYNDMRVIRHSQVSPMSSLSFNFGIHPGMSLTGCFVYPSFSPFICPSALTKMPFINHLNMCEGVKRNGRENLRETDRNRKTVAQRQEMVSGTLALLINIMVAVWKKAE